MTWKSRSLVAALVAAALPAQAAETLAVSHYGRLLGADDQPVNEESLSLSFKLFELSNAVANEQPLWTGSCTAAVRSGHYSVMLGESCGTDLRASYFPTNAARYLEVSVAGTPLSPRLAVGSVPTAGVASNALALGGETPDKFWKKADAVDAASVGGKSLDDLKGMFLQAGGGGQGDLTLTGGVTANSFTTTGAVQAGSVTAGGIVATGGFAGDGAELTGLDAANITTGVLADARIPENVARLGANNVFGGNLGIGLSAAPTERLQVDGNAFATNYLTYVPAIDDIVRIDPYKRALYAGSTTIVRNAVKDNALNFPAPSVLSENGWDWSADDDVWTDPRLPAGTNRAWARLTFSIQSASFHGPCFFLRREYFNVSANKWERVAGEADIKVPCLAVGLRERNATATVWVPWWTTLLPRQTRAGATQRLLVSMESNFAAEPVNALTVRINGLSIELFASKTGKAQTFSTSTTISGDPIAQPSIDVPGAVIRKMYRWHANSGDDQNSGILAGRRIEMVKTQADTGIRVLWTDNFRVNTYAQGCEWEVLFNGEACNNPARIYAAQYEGATSSNRHDPGVVAGTCFGTAGNKLGAGPVTITTRVGQAAGYSTGDCSTGWNQSSYLEAEEVR